MLVRAEAGARVIDGLCEGAAPVAHFAANVRRSNWRACAATLGVVDLSARVPELALGGCESKRPHVEVCAPVPVLALLGVGGDTCDHNAMGQAQSGWMHHHGVRGQAGSTNQRAT